ncbi:hypothetical protein [Mumia zhuanghuii]|uniref:Uncharacterized protein n=1 Tax=Mumia zhuanghuii TaxID=2585211 RepID=A0A5C4MKN1_9ACTN|nr:hypothetical protein [Mumia zhuanghuii]TNC34802.1 hypothetical protein FHE65_27485 [Mumia zhuanghuii]TNC42827.1 hypothetical protein FHE65_20255 [Mumia zhuanghuii]
MVESGARLPLVHVITHDGSASAHGAFERVSALTEETVLVFRDVAPPPEGVGFVAAESPMPALTVDSILRTARATGAAYVTIPASLFSAERVLISTIDAIARLATPTWPAVSVQVLRGASPLAVRKVLVVASHGQSSGALLLVATLAAVLSGASLTKLVVGGDAEERVRTSVRGADADLAATLRERYALPVAYLRLPPRVDSLSLERAVASIEADLVVTGMGKMTPGLSYRDLSRDGRRRLLAGPLRVEHVVLRSTRADAMIVIDGARLRRRPLREGITTVGLGEFFVGDLDRFDEVVQQQRQARNQAAEFGSS